MKREIWKFIKRRGPLKQREREREKGETAHELWIWSVRRTNPEQQVTSSTMLCMV